MAEQQEEVQLFPSFYIANWNSMGPGPRKNRDRVYKHYLRECKEQDMLPDLVFLQEVTFNKDKSETIQREALQEVFYEGVFEINSTKGQYNCVLYNKRKFSLEDSSTELELAYKNVGGRFYRQYPNESLKNALEKHMSLAALSVKDHRKAKIIAVSIHNIYKGGKQEMFDMITRLLCELNNLTGIPVLLAGDFNMPMETYCWYKLTEHRESQDLIDAILLIDCRQIQRFLLVNVEAYMISKCSLEGCEWTESLDVMAQRHAVSNHDPLTAKLQQLDPAESYSVFSWNAARIHEANYDHWQIVLDQELSKAYDLVFLQEVPNQFHLPYSDRYGAVSSDCTAQPRRQSWVIFNKHKVKLNEHQKNYSRKAFNRLKMKVQCFIIFSRENFKNSKKTVESLKRIYPQKETQVKDLVHKMKHDEKFRCKLHTLYNRWDCLKDLGLHYVCAMVHKISEPPEASIIVVSFHNRDENPKSMLNILLYLLEELHDLTGYPILLAGGFKMDLSIAKQPEFLLPYNPQRYKQSERREQQHLPCVDYILFRGVGHLWWTMDKVTSQEIDVLHTSLKAEDDSQEQIQPALQRTIKKMYPKLQKELMRQIYPELEGKIIEHIDLEVIKAIRSTFNHDPLVTHLRQWFTCTQAQYAGYQMI